MSGGWYLSIELNVGRIRDQIGNTLRNMKNPKRILDLVIQRQDKGGEKK
jgi:hypothetical protein